MTGFGGGGGKSVSMEVERVSMKIQLQGGTEWMDELKKGKSMDDIIT